MTDCVALFLGLCHLLLFMLTFNVSYTTSYWHILSWEGGLIDSRQIAEYP